jgi:hypothetical protein
MSLATTGTSTQVLIAPPAGDIDEAYMLVEEVSDIQIVRGWDALDVTNFDSKVDKESIKALRNPGRYTMRGNWRTNAPGQVILRQAFEDKRPYRFYVILPPNPGDAVGETWSFSALVLTSDPLQLAPGKKIEFESLLQATGRRSAAPVYLNAFGSAAITISRSIGNTVYAAKWENFSLRSFLPADVEIQGIYPVIIASAVHDQADSYFRYGTGLDLETVVQGFDFLSPSNPNGTSFSSTEWYGLSIGTDLADLTGQQIRILLNQSLDIDVLTDVIEATAVGFAVVYKSEAIPSGTPQMPPPFAIPPGQAVAWALPSTSSQLGVQIGGGGIFDPGTGYGLATPAAFDPTQYA